MLGDWLETVGWPNCGELDILEYLSYRENTIHCAIHCKTHNHIDKTQCEKHVKLDSAEEAFHIYGLEGVEDDKIFPAVMEVDYVRVYQKKSSDADK